MLFLSGCQCLVPVAEPEDAGFTPQSCTAASDCGGVPAVTSRCTGAGFSCVDLRCIAECSDVAGQTCVTEPGHCLVCPRGAACIPPSCSGIDADFRVEELDCDGTPPLAPGAAVHEAQPRRDAGECGGRLTLADGGLLGRLYLQSARGLTVESPLLGGTCLAYELPTGAARLLLDCPRCQVVLGP